MADMMTVVTHLVALLAGFLTCDALRVLHARRIAELNAADWDAACQQWAADPEFWCNRPGCPICWDTWGRP
jgi:hypothetical protein